MAVECESKRVDDLGGLVSDLGFLLSMPELCDVVFIVGQFPLYGVRAFLAIRSRVLYRLLFGPKSASRKSRSIGETCSIPRRFRKMLGFNDNDTNTDFLNKTIIHIDDFDVKVFEQLLNYLHTGTVILSSDTVIGLMNAAEHFSLKNLRKVCNDFAYQCINVDSVCTLLSTAEHYIQFKSTKILIQKVLEFIDVHAEQVLSSTTFVHLPEHVVHLIISRENLLCSTLACFRTLQRWTHFRALIEHPSSQMRRFVSCIDLHRITPSVLITEIRPMQIVTDVQIMSALAHQADANSVDISTRNRPKTIVEMDKISDNYYGYESMNSSDSGYWNSGNDGDTREKRVDTKYKSKSVDDLSFAGNKYIENTC